MFKSLIDIFSAPDKPADLQPQDAPAALATLMVRVARADQQYDETEQKMILAVLQSRYSLNPEQAKSLREHAEELEAKAPDTVRFTKIIKQAVPYEDRREVVEALWRVAMADGARDHEEDGFLRLVAKLLGVNDRDSGLIRQRVIRELDGR